MPNESLQEGEVHQTHSYMGVMHIFSKLYALPISPIQGVYDNRDEIDIQQQTLPSSTPVS